MLETLEVWDIELLIFLNNLGTETYDSFWVFVTQIESWAALFIYFFVLIFHFYKGKQAWILLFFLVFTVTFTLVCTNFVKELVERLRPNNTENLVGLLRALEGAKSYSFWSGHAASSFSVTTFMVLSLRKFNPWVYLFYLWPVLFVSSRIMLGVHYPSDILTGAVMGICFAGIIYSLCKATLQKIAAL